MQPWDNAHHENIPFLNFYLGFKLHDVERTVDAFQVDYIFL